MCNCTSEVWSFGLPRAAIQSSPLFQEYCLFAGVAEEAPTALAVAPLFETSRKQSRENAMRRRASGIRMVVTGQLSATALLCAAMGTAGLAAAHAQTANSPMLEVPAHSVPVPTDVSPQMAKIIGLPLRTNWNVLPKTGEEWKPVADAGAAAIVKNIPGMTERLHVKIEKTVIDGVRAFVVTPDTIPPENKNRLLIHVHGGRYVLNPGEAALPAALFMAGVRHFQGGGGGYGLHAGTEHSRG